LVIDLFAGCGGMSLGFEAHGFPTLGYEMNRDACATYRKNLLGDCQVAELTPETPLPKCGILVGGPPCQPFSVGGNQGGLTDARDGFPIFLAAIKQCQPELLMIENVRGLMYRNRWYLDEILEAIRSYGYVVEFQLLNASAYDIPQNRERIFIVGHRGTFKFPPKANQSITAGDALGSLAQEIPEGSRFLTASMDAYIAKYEKASQCVRPRDLHLDRPARTVTCRNIAGATGDMQRVRLADGRRRRLVPREAARLQSFPDWFEFIGTEQSVFNQVGNAVPPMLGYQLAGSCHEYWKSDMRLPQKAIHGINARAAESHKPQQLSLFG
jgi:DNA (cytosine-5)-methyltransferase 1